MSGYSELRKRMDRKIRALKAVASRSTWYWNSNELTKAELRKLLEDAAANTAEKSKANPG